MKTAKDFLLEYLELDEITPEDVVFTEDIHKLLNAYAAEAVREAAERAVTKFGKCCDCDCDDDEVPECRSCRFLVDKQSILNILNELK